MFLLALSGWGDYSTEAKKSDALFIRKIHEGMPIALALQVRVGPSLADLLLVQILSLFLVQSNIDCPEHEGDDELDAEKNHYRDFPRDILRRVTGLEDLRADDVAGRECGQGQSVHGRLPRNESQIGRRATCSYLLSVSSDVGSIIRVDGR